MGNVLAIIQSKAVELARPILANAGWTITSYKPIDHCVLLVKLKRTKGVGFRTGIIMYGDYAGLDPDNDEYTRYTIRLLAVAISPSKTVGIRYTIDGYTSNGKQLFHHKDAIHEDPPTTSYTQKR